MANLTAEQIEQKKQQLKQLSEEMNAIIKELQEAGAWPLDEDELDQVVLSNKKFFDARSGKAERLRILPCQIFHLP